VAQRKNLIKQIKSNKKVLCSIPSCPTQRDNIRDTNKALPILYTSLFVLKVAKASKDAYMSQNSGGV